MRLLVFACLVLGARAATLPDKTDIEKKLINVVKEVLDKEPPQTDIASEPELEHQPDNVKDVENNLRKSPQVADIPVKVIVEDAKPELRADPDKKEDNEVAPESEEINIKRAEIDLKNPGPPQHMEHDTQNPEHFDDSQQPAVVNSNTLNSLWVNSPQYAAIQQDLQSLKNNFNNRMNELIKTVNNIFNNRPAHQAVSLENEKPQENINLRASMKQDQPAGGSQNWWDRWVENIQQSIQNMNNTMNAYFANQTQNVNNADGTNTNNWLSGIGNTVNQQGQQGDEQKPPQNNNWFTNGWNNLQQVFSGSNNNNQPQGVQADSPQPAPQPVRPFQQVIQQVQNAFSNAFSPNNNNNQPVAAPPAQAPSKPAEPAQPTEPAGSNSVPSETKPEAEKEKEQKKPETPTAAPAVTQSGPIKQLIGNNPIVQGIAGTVQRFQQTLNPVKPRDEVKDAGSHDDGDVKAGFYKPPARPATGDNNNSDSSGVEEKNAPVDKSPEIPQTEPVKEEVPVPVVPEKTE